MRLTMNEKRSVTKLVAARYQKASKKEKCLILDEFTQLIGYDGHHQRSYYGWCNLMLRDKRIPSRVRIVRSRETFLIMIPPMYE